MSLLLRDEWMLSYDNENLETIDNVDDNEKSFHLRLPVAFNLSDASSFRLVPQGNPWGKLCKIEM